MDSTRGRNVLVIAIAAPVITALVMGALIFRKMADQGDTGTEPAPVTKTTDARAEAIYSLAAADSLAPDAMVQLADEADRKAGAPLAEAALVRARAARKRGDAAGERAAVDRALEIDPARPESQLARVLVAADAWARGAAPLAPVHAPSTTIASPLLVPPSPEAEPGIEKFEGRAGLVAKFLAALRARAKPEEIAPVWTEVSAGGVDDRLAFALGVHSLRMGAPDDATPWLRSAISAAPQDPARLRCAALAALLDNDAAGALPLIQRWSETGGAPRPAEALGWWAVAARQLGDQAEARRRLDEAVKLDPEWRGARGWLAYQMGDKAQALDDATVRRDADPWARYLRALLHWDAGEVDPALAECAALLQAWPEHYEAHVLQARGLAARGRVAEAEDLWKRAHKLAANRPEARLGLAEFYASTGRRDEAIQAFLDIPNDAYAHWRGGQLILDAGRTAEALRWAELGVQRYSQDARQWSLLARVCHARLDHFYERNALEKAATLAPADAEIKKQMTACVEEMKRE